MAPKYTITYHRNHSSSDSTTQSFTQSSSLFTLKTVGELGWEAPSGYSFSEWNTAADGSGMPRDPDMTASADDWYAIWEPLADPVPYIATDQELTSVASAIRSKGGTSSQLEFPSGFVSAIGAITAIGDVTQRTSSDLTASGATVTAPAGYYASAASKSVTSGTAGTPTATKGSVSNHAISVTPSVTNTTGYITGGTKSGTAVSVAASELVSGSLSITENDTYDVTNYASAVVSVGGGGATWTEHIDQGSPVNVADFILDDYVDFGDMTTIWRIKMQNLQIDNELDIGCGGPYTDTEFLGIGGVYYGYQYGVLAHDGGSNNFFVNMDLGYIVANQLFTQDYSGVTDGDVISFQTLSST